MSDKIFMSPYWGTPIQETKELVLIAGIFDILKFLFKIIGELEARFPAQNDYDEKVRFNEYFGQIDYFTAHLAKISQTIDQGREEELGLMNACLDYFDSAINDMLDRLYENESNYP